MDREGKHTAQLQDAIASHLFVEMDNHFCISLRIEAMTASSEIPAQFRKVVNLPVVDNADSLVFVENRLVTTGQVDDAEPSYPQARPILYENALIVGSTVNDALAHSMDRGSFNSAPFRVDHSHDSTHGYRFTTAETTSRAGCADLARVRLRR